LKPGRLALAQIVEGGATINGAAVSAGDGVAIAADTAGAELLLFDLPE